MTQILRSPGNVWSDRSVTRAGILVDGDDYFRAFYEAAQLAERYILLAGWQFDSDACLLRGPAAEQATLPVTLLKYLDALCERNAQLRIYILAWDFHTVFCLEREWLQQLRFNWSTNERLTFLFDGCHVDQGSHHQKFVVIDGHLAFLGGLDLCDHRWDDRLHKEPNPLRISRGQPHKPFHDVQAYLAGSEASAVLVELFAARWVAAGGAALDLPPASPTPSKYEPKGAVPLMSTRIALSRTDPNGAPDGTQDCREIRDLYLDAIAAAERMIYIETQYFSSREVCAGLVKRLETGGATSLDVVIVLNMEAETLKEELAVGLAQAQVLGELRKAAAGTQHRLGVYYSMPHTEAGTEPDRATYVHSKIMIVDDRFLTVGSANLTNRSMNVDTELNVSAETSRSEDELGRSIARIRHSLLAEHLGIPTENIQGNGSLVAALDALAARSEGRLRLHPSPTEKELAVLATIDPQRLPFDPGAPEDQQYRRSIFVSGLGALWARLTAAADPALR